MSDESADRDPYDELYRRINEARSALSDEDQAYLRNTLTVVTDLLTTPPAGRADAERTWMGEFEPGSSAGQEQNSIKIGPAPDPRRAEAQLMHGLADVFAALARLTGNRSGTSTTVHVPGKIGR